MDYRRQTLLDVNRHLTPENRSLARPAQGAAALLGLMGAGLVQMGWVQVLDPRSSASRPSAATLLVLATAYLVASAWFYFQGAVTPNDSQRPRWALRIGLFADGMLSGTIVAVMTRGHQSGVLGLGVWTVPPVLFAFSAISATLTLFQWQKATRSNDGTRGGIWSALFRATYVRAAAALLLLGVLIVVEVGARSRATFR